MGTPLAGHGNDVTAVGLVRRTLDLLYLAAGYAAGVFLVAIFAIMMIMSIGRQFAFNIPAGDDFASWCMAAMAFLGLAHTFKRGEHTFYLAQRRIPISGIKLRVPSLSRTFGEVLS